MLRPCKYCGKEFECNDARKKTCGCGEKYRDVFSDFIHNMRARFMSPKYQYFRLYHDEDISPDVNGKTNYFYLRPCVEDIPFRF